MAASLPTVLLCALVQTQKTDGETERRKDGETGRQTDRQTGRQASWQTGRQTNHLTKPMRLEVASAECIARLNPPDRRTERADPHLLVLSFSPRALPSSPSSSLPVPPLIPLFESPSGTRQASPTERAERLNQQRSAGEPKPLPAVDPALRGSADWVAIRSSVWISGTCPRMRAVAK